MRCIIGLLLTIFMWSEALSATDRQEPTAQDGKKIRFLFLIDSSTIPGGLLEPSALFWDLEQQELYVTDTGNHKIYILDRKGHLIYQSQSLFQLSSALDVAVDSERIYISDADDNSVGVFNYRGEKIARLFPSRETKETFSPGRMAIGPDGSLLVADKSTQRIFTFDKSGRFLKRMVSLDPFYSITGLACSRQGEIFIVDAKGSIINIVDNSEKVLLRFGQNGMKPSDFAMPGDLCLDSRGDIWIVDAFKHEIKHFNRQGGFLGRYGRKGRAPGEFFFPIDIAFIPPKGLYVLEKAGKRIQVFEICDLAGVNP